MRGEDIVPQLTSKGNTQVKNNLKVNIDECFSNQNKVPEYYGLQEVMSYEK